MDGTPRLPNDLTDEDQEHIRAVFHQELVPKLMRHGARNGTLNCEFAGEAYKNWNIQFRSAGSDFEIVEFEYDEEGDSFDLDL
jgi:hypothetical protein